MTVSSPAVWVLARPEHAVRVREAAVLAASAAVDAVAAGILLVGTPLPRPLDLVIAGTAHLTAVLLVSVPAAERPSQRWLAAAALMTVPFAGIAVAAALLFTTGRGTATIARNRRARRKHAPTRTELLRMAGALSPCEALEGDDEDVRRDAFTALTRRGDPEAIVLLRHATAHRDPDVALSAALALDEIGERAERQLRRPELARVRHGAG